jgi:hypothetical protein
MPVNRSSSEVRERFVEGFPLGTGELAHWLWNDIANLHMDWNKYQLLFGADVETIDLLNAIASSFFSLTDRVLRHDILLRICRITDPAFSDWHRKKPNASLHHLVLKIDRILPIELKRNLDLSLAELDDKSRPIRALRDKRIAHSDFDEVLHLKADPLPGVNRQQVELVLANMRAAFGLLESHFLAEGTAFEHVIQANDAKKLLFHLRQVRASEQIEKLVLAGRYGIAH